mmetsp:Transcript_1324/g.2858  ORF Transcript_1324/g.2858 Transcript_1324/m.2858 type:complete len:850 (+) Transcript_1324:50-2599(+)
MMKACVLLLAHLLNRRATAEVASAPVIFQKSIRIDDGKWVANVAVREGQEPADAIFSALRPYGVDYDARRAVFDEAKRAGVPHTREHAQVFSQNIVLDDSSFSGPFTFYDNGRQPIDVIYDFANEHSIESHFRGLADALLPELCELVPCTRKRPRIWFNEITSDDGQQLGALEILEGDEAIDTVDSFVQRAGVDTNDRNAFRGNLLNVICKSIACSRQIPVVFRKAINDEAGRSNGAIEILENEEVIDAVVRFIRKSKLTLDEIALKNYMLQQACGTGRVKCTRNVAVVHNQKINSADGSPIGTLTIYENEEPVDKVYRWSQENSVPFGNMESILDAVCESELTICNRREPVYFSIPISGPDGGIVNTLELKVGHEPVDDMYGFFAANGLFKKEWDFHSVVKQICEKPNVDCRRQKAVKYFDHNFTMAGVEMGQLVIWEDEEVVDVLYNLRQSYNLTKEDQILEFNKICKEPEVVCERTQAVVFQKTEITKLDYEKFGNETCKRQFVGVKFRSGFVNLPFGSKMAEWLNEDSVKSVVEHPLFSTAILFLLLSTAFLASRIPRFKGKLHPAQHAVVALFLVFFVSVLQAVLVEPDTAVDQAMHTYEGKLPDLIVFEDEEPVDALLKWGKLAAKDHHPIVREPIYWDILDELCSETESLTCTRTRAWEFLNMGAMTYFGIELPIEIYNPAVDPIAQKECHPTMDGKANSCLEKAATQFCERLLPPPNNCVTDITMHIATQLASMNEKRLDEKCSYKRLSLEMDAPGRELYKKAASIARDRRMNISPFRRVDNGTVAFDTWSMETREAHTAVDTFQKIHDPEAREWNDKPCVPYFGGALCAKTDQDGNMMIG